MYGHFNLILKSFIIERQGGDSIWQSIVEEAGCSNDFYESQHYSDDDLDKLIDAVLSVRGLSRDVFLEMLGEYYLIYIQIRGYEAMLRNLGSNVLEFVQNLDSIHAYAKKEFTEMVAPSFQCEEDSVADRMTLHYYSAKSGLFSVAEGLIKSAGRIYYRMDVQMDIVSTESVTVAEENGFREHITVNIRATKIPDKLPNDRPPTLIAQTKKHSEKQILKEDVAAVRKKLEEMKANLGDDALPLSKERSAKARWKMVSKLSRLHKGFVPNYPESMAINPRMFIEIFPFHIMFDEDMKVVMSGIKIQMMVPKIRSRHEKLTDYFTLQYPRCVDLTYENIRRFIVSPFILEFKKDKMDKKWAELPALQIKGQMYLLRDKGYYIYMASPVFQSWQDMEQRTMKLAEVPMWDNTRDLVIVSDKSCRVGGCNSSSKSASGKGVKDELYRAYLPKDIIDLVHKGKVPSGEFHQEVTAIFCDVVQFLPMVARCTPSQVVGILNSLHESFDKITTLHGTQKVESIGDAYVVIAGVGYTKDNHAEKIANTALGMILLAAEVKSPLDGEPVQIRAGIHTGTIVTGVIGERVPRFLVMGETTLVASKLESHGIAGKIHVSPTTHKALENKGFVFEDRGLVELKGYGPLNTFFLVRNDRISDNELTGQYNNGNTRVTFINEGKQMNPLDKHNKVHPVKETPSSAEGSRPPTADSDLQKIPIQIV